MTPAERQRLHRRRLKSGRFVVPVELSGDVLDRLVARGYLADEDTMDRDLLAQELAALLGKLGQSQR